MIEFVSADGSVPRDYTFQKPTVGARCASAAVALLVSE